MFWRCLAKKRRANCLQIFTTNKILIKQGLILHNNDVYSVGHKKKIQLNLTVLVQIPHPTQEKFNSSLLGTKSCHMGGGGDMFKLQFDQCIIG